jgi:hypothetical protein
MGLFCVALLSLFHFHATPMQSLPENVMLCVKMFVGCTTNNLFVRLISHQPAVLFSQNKLVTSNQPTILFSQNKSAPAISHQPIEQAERFPLLCTQIPDAQQNFGARQNCNLSCAPTKTHGKQNYCRAPQRQRTTNFKHMPPKCTGG